jgi:triacylglycerol lipase
MKRIGLLAASITATLGCAQLERDIRGLKVAQVQKPDIVRDVRRQPSDPPEPIILMHGMAGWKKLAGIEYFNDVEELIEKEGYLVFATEVDPFNAVEKRAQQAAEQIEEYMKEIGAEKVHLIGHSQGGLDARHLVAGLGWHDRVATVTSIGTPHQGTAVSDIAYFGLPGPAQEVARALVNTFARDVTGRETDIEAQLKNLSQRHARDVFNPANPDHPDVEYYSYGGKTQASVMADNTREDVCNPALLLTYELLKAKEGNNDGLVSLYSSMWGKYLGTLAADHFDEVGQPPGRSRVAFNPTVFYPKLARFLQGDGPAPRGK